MEAIISFVQSVLGLKARQGWIFLLIGSAMITLVRYEYLPREEVGGWLAVFVMIAVAGASILLVSLGEWLIAEKRGRDERQMAERASTQQREREAENIRSSLPALIGEDRAELYSVVKAGSKRVPFEPGSRRSLWGKKFLRPVDNRGEILEVHDGIWAIRDEIIDRFERKEWFK